MRVPGEHQPDGRGHAREGIGAVAEEDGHAARRAHRGERPRQVGVAGVIVVEPADRERAGARGGVVEDADSRAGERGAGGGGVSPVIVVAEHGEGAESAAEARERCRRLGERIVVR